MTAPSADPAMLVSRGRQNKWLLPKGWFGNQEWMTYANIANRLHKGVWVEVGVYLGRSFVGPLLRNIFNQTKQYAVDPWPNEDIYKAWQENMKDLGFEKGVHFHEFRMSSVEASHRFGTGDVDVVFIDGDHRRRAVAEDIAVWWPKVKVGGLLIGHDYGGLHTGIKSAVDTAFGKPDWIVETLWGVHK